MADFPSLPLWTDAFVADTSHLSHAELGLYTRLIILIWRSPGCQIPADPAWLIRRFPADADALRSLCQEFCTVDGEWMTQKRLKREWDWCMAKKLKNVKAANVRWDKEKPKSGNGMQTHSERNAPIPTPEPLVKKELEGNGVEEGSRKKRKPRHGAKGNGRVWIDLGTSEWIAYAADYRDAHEGADPPLKYDGSGTWFKYHGENVT